MNCIEEPRAARMREEKVYEVRIETKMDGVYTFQAYAEDEKRAMAIILESLCYCYRGEVVNVSIDGEMVLYKPHHKFNDGY